MMLPRPLAVALLLGTLLAGCLGPDEGTGIPRIDIALEPQSVPADGVLWVNLTLSNDADRPFAFTSSDACVHWLVFVRVGGTPILLDRAEDTPGCAQVVTRHTLQPGEALEATFQLHLGEYRQNGAPLFAPATYRVEADLQAEEPTWDVSASRGFDVIEAEQALPRITLSIAPRPIQRGRESEIVANFTNDSDRWYNWTSADGCQWLRVWVDTPEGEIELFGPDDPAACTQALVEVSIPPGGARERVVTWDGATPWGGSQHVPPGRYTLGADFDHAGGSRRFWDASGQVQVTVE